MPRLIPVHHGRLRLARRNEDGVYALKKLRSRHEAKRFLTDYMYRPAAILRMRALLADLGWRPPPGKRLNLNKLPALELIDQLARQIVNERVVVAEEIERTNAPSVFDDRKDPPPLMPDSRPPPAKKKLTWIEFKVVEDASGQPMSPVRLIIKTPEGNEAFHTTSSEGLIRIDDIDQGSCDAKCDLKNLRMPETLVFARMGEEAVDEEPTGKRPGGTKVLRIAAVDAHRVRKGESIAGLAKAAGMTWQDLAKFNWGTDVPDEINKHLRDDVGCTKKTADGLNYVFDNSDHPGIVFIPHNWEQDNLATSQRHVLRVRRMTRFRVILETDGGLRIPEAAYEATLADGSEVSGRVGLGGVDAIMDPPEGEVEVRFPDLDDIEAKSLAAAARKAFDDRDPKEIHRLFRYPKQTIRRAFKAYDRYYNTCHGKGLRGDIEQEFGNDPDARLIFFAYMGPDGAAADTEDKDAASEEASRV
ncbi:MAG: LysM peptidoglycan-binding domain-containing protein [Tepidisphaerales bacterium]